MGETLRDEGGFSGGGEAGEGTEDWEAGGESGDVDVGGGAGGGGGGIGVWGGVGAVVGVGGGHVERHSCGWEGDELDGVEDFFQCFETFNRSMVIN